jgi:hypothetical protein
LEEYLPCSVTVGTVKGYAPGLKKWIDYLDTLDQRVHPGLYMDKLPDDSSCGKRLVLFMVYLYREKDLRDEQIKRVIASMSFQFEVTGRPTRCFKLDIVLRGRKAGVRNKVEARALDEKHTTSMSLQICIEMV